MVKTRARPFTSIFQKKGKQENSTDENGLPTNKAVKIVEQTKRSAEDSPDNAPSRKRSAFGDITNATFNQQLGKDIKKKDANTTKVTRRDSIKQGQAQTKAKSKKRKSSVQTASHALSGFELDANSLSSEISNLQNSIEASSSQDVVDSSSQSTGFESEEDFDGSRPKSAHTNDPAVSSSDGSTSAQAEGNKEDDKALPLQTLEDQADNSVKPDVIDIDNDTSDAFAVSEYAYEIFNNMKRREECFLLTAYMETQQEITPHMRAILVDWLVEVQECFELYHETLYLAVKLLDHFLEKNTIKRQDLQLVGATTLLLSSKIEERHPPCMDDFIYICDDAYKQEQFIAMEKKIVCSLGFDINIPIPYRFLRRFAKAALANIETLTLARFILESSLLVSQFISVKASLMAASCLYLALLMKENGEWTPTLVHYTGYTKQQLRDCVLKLNAMNASPPDKNLMTVRSKYSHKVFHEVAKIPALDTLTMEI